MQKNTTPKINADADADTDTDTAPAVTIPAHKHTSITRSGGSVTVQPNDADELNTEDSQHAKKP